MFPGTFVISAPEPPPATGKEKDEHRFWKEYAKIIKAIPFSILCRQAGNGFYLKAIVYERRKGITKAYLSIPQFIISLFEQILNQPTKDNRAREFLLQGNIVMLQ
jgi:hypothetical protein